MVVSQAVFLIVLAEYCLLYDNDTMRSKHLSVSLQGRTVNGNSSHVGRTEICKLLDLQNRCIAISMLVKIVGLFGGITAIIFRFFSLLH